MKDKSIRHYSDFEQLERLEFYRDREENIVIMIGEIDIFQPNKEIKFTKQSIKEIINDLNELIK